MMNIIFMSKENDKPADIYTYIFTFEKALNPLADNTFLVNIILHAASFSYVIKTSKIPEDKLSV